MKDRFGARSAESQRMRAACVCGGHSLTKQEPLNNVARTTIETMAVACAGLQSVFTAAYDEAFAIPTELSARTALRVQQIVAHETDVAKTVDPLGGSYFVETLTNELERAAWEYIERIDAMGGMVAAIERSYPQREIAEASYRYQMAVDKKEKIIVGVNDFVAEEKPLDILQIDETVAHRQAARLKKLRADRSQAEVDRRLNALRTAAKGKDNLTPFIYDAVKSYATLGEICDALRDVFGTYEEVAIT